MDDVVSLRFIRWRCRFILSVYADADNAEVDEEEEEEEDEDEEEEEDVAEAEVMQLIRGECSLDKEGVPVRVCKAAERGGRLV